jgi:CspA family cold shock protein
MFTARFPSDFPTPLPPSPENLDFSDMVRHMTVANVACDGNFIPPRGLIFPSRATSSAGAFAGGFLCFRERKHPMPTGIVKFFNTDKGYGFIENEDGSGDIFVHISAVERAGMSTLNKEQRVSFEAETGKNGKTSAVNLQSA